MAAAYVVFPIASIPLFGDPVRLGNGTEGRQRTGTIQEKRVNVQHATPAELASLIATEYPGGVGDFQLEASYPEVSPWIQEVNTTYYQGTLKGFKRTAA